MEKQDQEFTDVQNHVAGLLKLHMDSAENAIVTLERKAQSNFVVMNIIAAIGAALNVEFGDVAQKESLITILSILIGVSYFAVAWLSILVLKPRKQATWPMPPKWDMIQKWLKRDTRKYLRYLVAEYERNYSINSEVVEKKSEWVLISHLMLIVMMGLLFAQVVIYQLYVISNSGG